MVPTTFDGLVKSSPLVKILPLVILLSVTLCRATTDDSKSTTKVPENSSVLNKAPSLKFLDDIKKEREQRRKREKEKRFRELSVRKFDSGGEFRELSGPDASEGSDFAEILKAPASNSTPASFEPVAAASSSDYVSFFDDFDNSLLTDDNDHEDYEQQLPSKSLVTKATTTTTTTTTPSTIRPSQTTSSLADWQPLFHGSSEQEGFGAWIGGVNNRFPVSYADVQPKFVIPIEVNGGKEIQYVQSRSSSSPNDQEPTPGDIREISLPPPNSIAEVLEPISRVIYKEKTFRRFDSEDDLDLGKHSRAFDVGFRGPRFDMDGWMPVSDRRKLDNSGRSRRNAFSNRNDISRQDFEEGPPTTGIRRPDTYSNYEFESGGPHSRDEPGLPFEARNADPDPEIRGPQDFYSEGHPKPDPGYAGDGYDPRNSPYSDPNETYDPNQPPAYGGPPYPEAESPPTASGPGPSGPGGPGGPTGPRGSGGPSGPGGPEGDGYNNEYDNNNNNEYPSNEYPNNPGRGRNAPPQDDPEEEFFDHDFQPLGRPRGPELARPRTFFEDFRGFFTSSNEFSNDGYPGEGGGGGRGGQRGRPRAAGGQDEYGNFEEDEDDDAGRRPQRRPPRRRPPPPNEDYDDPPPPPPRYSPGPRNYNGYPDDSSEDKYPGSRPHGFNRHRPNPYGKNPDRPDDGDGGPGGYGPETEGRASKPWNPLSGLGLPQIRTNGRPTALNYGYFRRRNNNVGFGGGLFG